MYSSAQTMRIHHTACTSLKRRRARRRASTLGRSLWEELRGTRMGSRTGGCLSWKSHAGRWVREVTAPLLRSQLRLASWHHQIFHKKVRRLSRDRLLRSTTTMSSLSTTVGARRLLAPQSRW